MTGHAYRAPGADFICDLIHNRQCLPEFEYIEASPETGQPRRVFLARFCWSCGCYARLDAGSLLWVPCSDEHEAAAAANLVTS